MHDGQIVGNGGVIVRGTHKQTVCIAVRGRRKGCPAQLPAIIQRNVLLRVFECTAVVGFCAAGGFGLKLQKQTVCAGVELVQYRCTIGHALCNDQCFICRKVEPGILGLIGHANRFTRNGVTAFFACGIAACIQGRIVPVVGAHNNIVAAGDPLRYRLGNAVGFLVDRGY